MAVVVRDASELEQTLLAATVIFGRNLDDLISALLPALDNEGAERAPGSDRKLPITSDRKLSGKPQRRLEPTKYRRNCLGLSPLESYSSSVSAPIPRFKQYNTLQRTHHAAV
jgi:hypothetical protein